MIGLSTLQAVCKTGSEEMVRARRLFDPNFPYRYEEARENANRNRRIVVNLCTLFEGGLWDSEHGECGAAQPALCGT